MSGRLGFGLIDVLILVLIVRLFFVKRSIDNYRPPSPLPRGMKFDWEAMTVVRVS